MWQHKPILLLLLFLFFSTACGLRNGTGMNFFSIKKDLSLGKRVNREIDQAPDDFPILPEEEYERVYEYIRGIATKILDTGLVKYRDKFPWTIKIIQNDNELNAFATPGGYIYIYTGLIKLLDSEDQFAGVLGHEIAHAAQRHSTRQMTKAASVSTLKFVSIGQGDALANMTDRLLSLRFSRGHELEADRYSVRYLCKAGYNPTGVAGFFKKLASQKSTPQFFSTHPNPRKRIQKIEKEAEKLNCPQKSEKTRAYIRIKHLLP